MPYVENRAEFAKRQGGGRPLPIGNSRFLFPNCGIWVDHPQMVGIEPPPADTVQFAALQLRYAQAVLADHELQFNNLRKYVIGQAEFHRMGAGPAPEPEAIADLKRLAKAVESARDAVEQAEAELASRRPPARQNYRDEATANANQILSEVRAIEI